MSNVHLTLKKHSQSETWLNLRKTSMVSRSNTRLSIIKAKYNSRIFECATITLWLQWNSLIDNVSTSSSTKPNLVSSTPRTKELRLENKTYFEGSLLKKAVRIYIAQLTCNDKQRETFEGRYANAFSWCPSTQTGRWTLKNDNRIVERQYLPYSNVLRNKAEPSYEAAC